MIDARVPRGASPGGDYARSYRDQWVSHCVEMAKRPADFYSGCRKINSCVVLEYPTLDSSLRIEDAGFTQMKLSMLRRLYWSPEHAEKVAELWRGRVERGKYGSVGVSTYHHLTKADPTKKSKRASVMGPCLLGVTFTLLDDRSVGVDAFYRTTELFKKFAADLVFIRDTVVPSMGVALGDVRYLRCHFANTTAHPMYGVTWLPLVESPIRVLEEIRAVDERMWIWLVKWTARFLIDEYSHGIQKFAQAMRVSMDARRRITGPTLAGLTRYLKKNHPGYTRTRFNHEETIDDGDDDCEE